MRGPLSVETVPGATSLHQRAFPEFFLSKLGPAFLNQLYRGFATDPSSVTVVECGEHGRVLGLAVGTLEPQGFFRRMLRRQFLGLVGASLVGLARNPGAGWRLLRGLFYRGDAPGARDGDALLSSICVDPAIAGRGLGAGLLQDWVDEVARRGCASAYLTTDSDGNDSVNAFYMKQGWSLETTYETPEGRKMNLWRWDQ